MATPSDHEPLDGTDQPPADELGALVGDHAVAKEWVADLRSELLAAPSDEVAARHLHAMYSALDPAGSRVEVVDLTQRRARRTLAGVAVAVGVLSLTGGLAAAGTLPAPVQDAVSSVAKVFAIDLPRSDEPDPAPADSIPPPADTVSSSSTSTSSTATSTTGTTRNPSITAPGRTGNNPSATAPGRTGNNPSATAPGRTNSPGGPPASTPGATAPGRTGDNPSATAPGRAGRGPSGAGPAD